MKRLFIAIGLLLTQVSFAQRLYKIDSIPSDSFYTLAPVAVRAVRVGENTPFTRTNLSKKEIQLANQGADLPFILNNTPSIVINSDAGNGIGYTGMRIRGTDATRINVTLNGVPFNDAESQGTFFVNLPDFSSSASSIQIQRGVGTSSNGPGAFGASVNISTAETEKEKYLEFNNSIGSFGSRKHTLQFGTGQLKGFNFSGRLSSIMSDGFIDRASSNLRSFYFGAGYSKDSNSALRLYVFSGKEKTYQAWYGVSERDLLSGNRTINYAGTEASGSPYKNETDNYHQTHYQFHWEKNSKKQYRFSTAFFLTRGKGYYEQYKAKERFTKYGLTPPTLNGVVVEQSDFIRQLWLDNYFYGNNSTLQLQKKNTEWTIGTTIAQYQGKHYGKLIWASISRPNFPHTWYNNNATKTESSFYIKQQTKVGNAVFLYYDLQIRTVNYRIQGFRNNPSLFVNNHYTFFNPKIGVTYRSAGWRAYASISSGAKEPSRDDFEAGTATQPLPEKLYDLELGLERKTTRLNTAITCYAMQYKNQLILTGKINDVGAYTRTNVPNSQRLGVELEASYIIKKWITTGGNLSFSQNRVKNLEEYIDDYDNGGQIKKVYNRSTLAFSPAWIANQYITITLVKKVEVSLFRRYVSRQYLDNTANIQRSLDPFFVQDLRINYSLQTKGKYRLMFIAQVNNLTNTKYEPNGYTFSYFYGGTVQTENYYFPMAGRNYLLTINIKR
ncbi:MAG: TonB-dependent receptor [Bacteroidetes bacterium]|nr:TonB-dependent receptor [Bacteroidota bacterium]